MYVRCISCGYHFDFIQLICAMSGFSQRTPEFCCLNWALLQASTFIMIQMYTIHGKVPVLETCNEYHVRYPSNVMYFCNL